MPGSAAGVFAPPRRSSSAITITTPSTAATTSPATSRRRSTIARCAWAASTGPRDAGWPTVDSVETSPAASESSPWAGVTDRVRPLPRPTRSPRCLLANRRLTAGFRCERRRRSSASPGTRRRVPAIIGGSSVAERTVAGPHCGSRRLSAWHLLRPPHAKRIVAERLSRRSQPAGRRIAAAGVDRFGRPPSRSLPDGLVEGLLGAGGGLARVEERRGQHRSERARIPRARAARCGTRVRATPAVPAPRRDPAAIVFTAARPDGAAHLTARVEQTRGDTRLGRATPARPAIVIGMKQSARPIPLSTNGTSRSTS